MMSRISNPSVADNPQPDYLQALNSVKYIANNGSEELKIEDIFDGSSGSGVRNFQPKNIVNRPTHFTQEEEKTLEQQILRIRDKIRRGELLSCQIASQSNGPALVDDFY